MAVRCCCFVHHPPHDRTLLYGVYYWLCLTTCCETVRVCIAYATASHLNVMKIIRMKPGAIARRYILLQYYKYCIPSRVVRPCVYDCVILTIVGDWGNQRTPGETSVPFWFLWSTFLGGMFIPPPIIILLPTLLSIIS